ncbi:MAG: hypothetical protein EOO50_05585 [Flavobacterium sp.]|uniref:hypothetical protein n=1 Tax=Flavobacterium sp. TaxID=239 RepID=UPI00121AC35B|nr:hypothetical protein [Flavobacterium sp.]RZJ67459.1 MAG: hypothetical protein EOO50_05585 [Flavobacterium sp.]
MKKIGLALLLLLFAETASACLNTYQFKIFPVGVVNGNIVSVDFKIRRTSKAEGNQMLDLGLKDARAMDVMWILDAYISTYDKSQKLLTSEHFEQVYSLEEDYGSKLQSVYSVCLSKIKSANPTIDLFKPDYISFCDYQQKCKLVAIESDTIKHLDYMSYNKKKHLLPVMRDTSYYGFGGNAPEKAIDLYVSSVRVYKSKNMTLVMSHLETGHEISMNLMDDSKEKKPNIAFRNIAEATYVEPLLHHGYGVDIFITS